MPMSSQKNILRFVTFFLNDSVTHIAGAKTSHHFIPAKPVKWFAQAMYKHQVSFPNHPCICPCWVEGVLED